MTDWRNNLLLAMLPEPVVQRLEADAGVVSAQAGDALIDPGEPMADVYFPLDLVASLDQVVGNDIDDVSAAPSVALTGCEGVVGIEVLFGAETSTNRATVRVAGRAIRIGVPALQEELGRAGVLQRLVLRSADALFAQVCANAACERVHTIQQRLVRWLLLLDDRSASQPLALTQDSLSQLLAVRRESVSAAARQLQADALIAYRRGAITVIDRPGIEARSCRCYREIKARYANHLQPG